MNAVTDPAAPPTIALLGTFDTKGAEHAFVADLIRQQGFATCLIDVGTREPPTISPEVASAEVAAAGGEGWQEVLARQDRGECVAWMAKAAAVCVSRLAAEGKIHGILSLGGGGGTAIATAAMRALPLGFPKVMVSTLASGNTAPYLGTSDTAFFPAVVDIAGLNHISRVIFENAAGAICGMTRTAQSRAKRRDPDRPIIVASMFGNTTACVNEARRILDAAGYEVLVFHATGTGGRSMESLIASGLVAGVLDVTTTEWADELVGGVLSAGPERLDATAIAKIPAIVVPGCLDMVNFGAPETIPEKFLGRRFYCHNPQVTLMRTTPEECAELGRILAEKLNRYAAPVTVLLPRGGISLVSAPGLPFHDPVADAALFDALLSHLRPGIPRIDLPLAINDPAFAAACAEALLAHLPRRESDGASAAGAA